MPPCLIGINDVEPDGASHAVGYGNQEMSDEC